MVEDNAAEAVRPSRALGNRVRVRIPVLRTEVREDGRQQLYKQPDLKLLSRLQFLLISFSSQEPLNCVLTFILTA